MSLSKLTKISSEPLSVFFKNSAEKLSISLFYYVIHGVSINEGLLHRRMRMNVEVEFNTIRKILNEVAYAINCGAK